jgi:hypothetical protein
MDLALIIGIVAAIGVAYWQFRAASRARCELDAAVEKIPRNVAETIRKVLESAHQIQRERPELPWAPVSALDYADVNGDGIIELIAQYPSGAHGSELRIFSWRDGQFNELATLGAGTPTGFEIGDFDGDGRIEIKTEETDWSTGQPYVSAPRTTVLFRWNGTRFVEVSRVPTQVKS